MKLRFGLPLVLGGLALIFGACSLSNLPAPSAGGSPAASGSTSSTTSLSVLTETSRNQGVLVTPGGQRIDIRATTSGGTSVDCTAPMAVVQLSSDSNSRNMGGGLSAIIVGETSNHRPGAWIYSSDKFEAPENQQTGAATPYLGESNDYHGFFRGIFGWTYHIQGVANTSTSVTGTGKLAAIIVGYAENKKGIDFGKFKVAPGTQIGVYWFVYTWPSDRGHKFGHGPRYIISPAQIIGTPVPSGNKGYEKDHRFGPVHSSGSIFGLLRLSLLGTYTSYLTFVDKDGVSFDPDNNTFAVTGTDQDGNPATATIATDGTITIASNQSPPPI